MKRRRLPIGWFLTALLAGLALALGLSITALEFDRMKTASLDAGNRVIRLTGTVIADSISTLRLEITSALASATGSPLASAETFDARAAARLDLVPLLKANRLVASAYVGYPDGDAITMRAVDAADASVPGASRAAYIVLGSHIVARGAREHFWLYDRSMKPLGSGLLPANDYDPRKRLWYKAELNRATFSPPFVSYQTHQIVFALSQRSRTGSVVGLNVALTGFSAWLRTLRPTPSSLIAAIRTPDGVVVATSEMTALDEAIRLNGNRPVTIDQLGFAPLIAARAASPTYTAQHSGTYRDRDGRMWMYSVTPSIDTQGRFLWRRDVLAVPEDELLLAATNVRNVALALCLGIVFAMLPAAYLLSRLVTRPLDRLRKDALTLRSLDFSPQPHATSIFAEIEEFSRTFGTMRQHVKDHNDAAAHFVPHEFLEELGHRDITGLRLGDHREGLMTLMFADIRSFTTLSGRMSAEETFRFLNSYLGYVGPIVRTHGGFIDKYIGDAIFAMFSGHPGEAIDAAISMQLRLTSYNEGRVRSSLAPIEIGIGIHRGTLMLGTIGEEERFETTVISDAVNISARLEGLTKTFGAQILASADVVDCVDLSRYHVRGLGEVVVKGATHAVTVYEICDADPEDLLSYKMQTLERFEEGRAAYVAGDFTAAERIFAELTRGGADGAATYFLDRAAAMVSGGGTAAWDGVEQMEHK